VLPYNDRAAVQAAFAEHGSNIAAVITESAPCNMGVVTPEEGFNKFLKDTTAQHGALLILDEVLTGFRASDAGYWGLTGRVEGWNADLYTFGKVIGGGLPTAALGGRAEVMDYLAPLGPVYQAGTLSGNPVAMAAGIAQLENATDEVYAFLAKQSAALQDASAPAPCSRSPSAPPPPACTTTPTPRSRKRSATRRSSTPCWTRASTCRQACSKPGSSPPRTMTRRWTRSSRPCRQLPRPRRPPRPRLFVPATGIAGSPDICPTPCVVPMGGEPAALNVGFVFPIRES